MSDRNKLRRQATHQVRALSDLEHKVQSDRLCAQLHTIPALVTARMVGAYWPVRGEANILPALRDLLRRTIGIALPVVQGEHFTFSQLRSFDEQNTTLGAFDIPEPNGPHVPWGKIDVILVPGRAFDRSGNRLGSGRGYYDRSLARGQSTAILVGVALSCQLIDATIPAQDHDILMDWIVTDEEVIRVNAET